MKKDLGIQLQSLVDLGEGLPEDHRRLFAQGCEAVVKYLNKDELVGLLVASSSPIQDAAAQERIDEFNRKRRNFEDSKKNPEFTYTGWSGSTNVMSEVMYSMFDSLSTSIGEADHPMTRQDISDAVDVMMQRYQDEVLPQISE